MMFTLCRTVSELFEKNEKNRQFWPLSRLSPSQCSNGEDFLSKRKNPVSLLYELLFQDGFLPTYNLKMEENHSIKCTVSAKNKNVTLMGHNQKYLKNKATIILLKELYGHLDEVACLAIPEEYGDDGSNPVGELQELCQKNRDVLPQYMTNSIQGTCLFKTKCMVYNFVTEGEGYSKKVAKKISAQKMMTLLMESQTVRPVKESSKPNQQLKAAVSIPKQDIKSEERI